MTLRLVGVEGIDTVGVFDDLQAAGIGPNISSMVWVMSTAGFPAASVASIIL
jgi:hypothetical protein